MFNIINGLKSSGQYSLEMPSIISINLNSINVIATADFKGNSAHVSNNMHTYIPFPFQFINIFVNIANCKISTFSPNFNSKCVSS